MLPRTRTVSCATAVEIPDTIIATAPKATAASVATVILYLAFISSSHGWSRCAQGIRVPRCDPPLTLRAAVFRSVASSRGRSRRFHDVRNEAAYPSVVPDLRRSTRSLAHSSIPGSAKSVQGAGALGQAENMIVLFTDFGLPAPIRVR